MGVVKLEIPTSIKDEILQSFKMCPISRADEFVNVMLSGFEFFLGTDEGLSVGLFWNDYEIGQIPIGTLADNTIDDDDEFDAPHFLRQIADKIESRQREWRESE